jgi:cell division ATPase FtsA
MSFLGFKSKSERFGVIVDIGSGSVLLSIVHSKAEAKHPTIIWSHRENAPLRNIDSIEQSSKSVITALFNAAMVMDSEGRRALNDYQSGARVDSIQCGISAPWSYTVTKTINYAQDEAFEITDELIADLIQTVQEKISADLNQNKTLSNLGLEVVLRSTLNILSNGYIVREPQGQKSKELNIAHANVVVQKKLVEAIEEMQSKIFANADIKKLSFIVMLYSVAQDLLPKTFDSCLVDITFEATEIGIVRNGVMTYCTHIPFGSFSLAREISAITNAPLHESLGYLHSENPYSFIEKLSSSAQSEVEKVFEAYINKVSELFHETGDRLSIPKHISLHSDLYSEKIFTDLIEKAAKKSTKTEPIITPISKELIKQTYAESTETVSEIPVDTALLVSAQFFHKEQKFKNYDYL